MKSNRTRLQPHGKVTASLHSRYRYRNVTPVQLSQMPAPVALPQISPDQVVADILISTLERIQRSSSPEVSAAAARYLSVFR
jgi:hypothetical protein